MADRAFLERLTKELIGKGKLIESGFVSLRLAAVPLDAPAVQIEEMRNAFFAGAQHLFASIICTLDPGEEPTDDDMRRLDLIRAELDGFIADFARRRIPTEGSA